MSQKTTSVLADHYKALGREEKAAAIRTWLTAVKSGLMDEWDAEAAKADRADPLAIAELKGGVAIINVLLSRMNEASDAAPAGPCMCGRPEGHAVHDEGMPNGHAFQDSNDHPAAP